jgi:hypothetical protein
MDNEKICSRREFMRGSALAVAGVCLASCQFNFPGSGQATDNENFYIANKKKIMKDINNLIGYVQKTMLQSYDETQVNNIVEETLKQTEELLPDLPYIGGFANDLTQVLYQSAVALAFYRVMKSAGQSINEVGRIMYLSIEAQVTSAPLMSMAGRVANSKLVQDQSRGEALESQKRKYPGDWVFNFVEGNGVDFDYGIDYTECGLCKYYRAQDAMELAPYLCLGDFPISKAMNSGLVRTSTLAHGADRCDFRWKTGRPIQMEWVPDFLK